MTHQLRRKEVVRASLEEVFTFFKDPYNLEAITPPWLAFKVDATTERSVRVGTEIRYTLRLHGIPMRWKSRISEYVEGESFTDEMLRGPYRTWHHRHLFRPVEGGVEIEDVVDYVLPFGPLGRLVHALVVRRQLARIFDYRATQTARLFHRSTSHPNLAAPR